MIRKTLLGALMLVVLSSTAWAQTPKVEFTGIIGWSLSDGVSGDPIKAANGQTYDRVDPQDSVNFGFSLGFFLSPSAEIGFLWRRQATQLDVAGTSVATLGDSTSTATTGTAPTTSAIPRRRPARTSWAASARPTTAACRTPRRRRVGHDGERHPVLHDLGRGPEGERVAERGDEVRYPVDADLHQVGCGRLVVRPVVGCYVIGDAQYSNQFEFIGGISFRF